MSRTLQTRGVTYIFKEDHRDGTAQKSQWTISEDDEFRSFEYAFDSNWIEENVGWGLYLVNTIPAFLGVAELPNRHRLLFIAKFVGSDRGKRWHGYPANPQDHQHDTPSNDVLLNWSERGFVSRAKMRKILKGQPCNL